VNHIAIIAIWYDTLNESKKCRKMVFTYISWLKKDSQPKLVSLVQRQLFTCHVQHVGLILENHFMNRMINNILIAVYETKHQLWQKMIHIMPQTNKGTSEIVAFKQIKIKIILLKRKKKKLIRVCYISKTLHKQDISVRYRVHSAGCCTNEPSPWLGTSWLLVRHGSLV